MCCLWPRTATPCREGFLSVSPRLACVPVAAWSCATEVRLFEHNRINRTKLLLQRQGRKQSYSRGRQRFCKRLFGVPVRGENMYRRVGACVPGAAWLGRRLWSGKLKFCNAVISAVFGNPECYQRIDPFSCVHQPVARHGSQARWLRDGLRKTISE